MHEIFHIFGICPDSMSHPDLLDFIFLNWIYVNQSFKTVIKLISEFIMLIRR